MPYPGSPALDTGSGAVCADPLLNNQDQRGLARTVGTACDIGAFESHGFNLAYGSGSPQSTLANTAFADPLALTLTSGFSEPVNGGQVVFTGPGSGASTNLRVYIATISGGDPSECTVSPASITLNAGNWQSGVSFTVSGVNDGLIDGDQPCTIASTADSVYSRLDPADLTLTVGEICLYLPLIANKATSGPDSVIDSLSGSK